MKPIPFKFDTKDIRVVTGENGEPWFNATDVCDALEMGNPSQAIKSHVDGDDLQKLEVIDNLGRTQRANHVNESGLYALILGSTKDSAKRFKRWITSEVLPAIRKTGIYAPDNGKAHHERLGLDLLFADKASQMLNLPNSGKLSLLKKIENVYHLTPMLPNYAVDEGTGNTGSSLVAHSATELLRQHAQDISTQRFNKALRAMGMLVEQTRPSTKTPDKMRTFWSVAGEGLRFGKNGISIANPRETQPEWFDEKFAELVVLVRAHLGGTSEKAA